MQGPVYIYSQSSTGDTKYLIKGMKSYRIKKFFRYKKKVNIPRKWSELSYAGESRVPQGLEPLAGSWPLYSMKRNENGKFSTLKDCVLVVK